MTPELRSSRPGPRLLCALLTALLLTASTFTAPAVAADLAASSVGDPIGPGLWRLYGTDPSLPQDDLAPLLAMIGKASVVGLGESIHTSGGFYQLKHRIIRELVQRQGFRLLTFETGWVGADRVEAYLQSCAGSPETAMQSIFGIWQSTEVRDLLSWLCQWNRTHKRDRVHFMGFDIQNDFGQIAVNVRALRPFLRRIGIAATDPRYTDLDRCDGVVESRPFGDIRTEDYVPCSAALQAIGELFTRDAAKIQRKTGKKDFAWAKLHRLGMAAWEDASYLLRRGGPGYTNARDGGMAATFLGLRELRFPKLKAIVWAHNAHISRNNHEPRSEGARWMGAILTERLGSSYFSAALGAKVTETDWDIACGPFPGYGDAPSLENTLHLLGEGNLLIDLDKNGVIPPGLHRLGDMQTLPADQWDALLYLEESPKMHPLAWPACG